MAKSRLEKLGCASGSQKLVSHDQSEASDRELQRCVNLVLIGGPDSPAYAEWSVTSSTLESILTNTNCSIDIYSYSYEINLDDQFSWESYLTEGEMLLEALSSMHPQTEALVVTPSTHAEDASPARLLCFVCHGLGGYILKKALVVANTHGQRYSTLLHSLCGLIFLGTPHCLDQHLILSEINMYLLRSSIHSFSNRWFTGRQSQCYYLARINRLFDDIRLRVEILSVYEAVQVKKNAWFSKLLSLMKSGKKRMYVSEDIVKIAAERETCVGVLRTYDTLCVNIFSEEDKTTKPISLWMRAILKDESLSEISHKVSLLNKPPSPTTSWTSISSYDAARRALSHNLHGSVLAERYPREDSADLHKNSNVATAGSSALNAWEVVPLVHEFGNDRRLAKLPCFMLDTFVRSDDFFPRQTILDDLKKCLLPRRDLTHSSEADAVPRHAVLCGLGGLGKTTIAMEFAHWSRDHFDAIFWIRADEQAKLEQDFSNIAKRLGLERDTENADPVVSRELARGWLANPTKVLDQEADLISQTEARWLLIFDNADRPDILHNYWPLVTSGSILVTSRDPHAKVLPSIATKSIDVPLLTDEEGAEMLKRLSLISKDHESAVQIANILGGLPIAIRQMAAVIKDQYLSFSDFLKRYQDDDDRRELHTEELRQQAPVARGNVATIWAIEQLDSISRTLLEICTMLDPDTIQDRLFLEGIGNGIELSGFPIIRSEYYLARGVLIKRSLVTRNEETENFWVHRVLQDSVTAKMSKERFVSVYATTVHLVSLAWGTTNLIQRHDTSLSQQRVGLFPHALRLQTMYERHDFLRQPDSSLGLATLLNEAGWWQHERGNSHDIKNLLSLAQTIAGGIPGEASAQLIRDTHYGLAAVANETNDKQACLYHTETLLTMGRMHQEQTRTTDLRLAIAYNEYAIALVMNHDFENAITHFETATSIYKSLPDYWPGMDTNPRTNIGFTLWALGRYDEAFAMLEALLRDREVRFGVMDRESYRTGRVYHGLGNIATSQGRLEESENFHRKAVQQWQSTIGDSHHKTADGYIRVARHCMRRGAFEEASSFLTQALTIYKRRSETYRPQVARTLFTQAQLLFQQESEKEAVAKYQEAKHLREQIPWAPKTADATVKQADFDELLILWSR